MPALTPPQAVLALLRHTHSDQAAAFNDAGLTPLGGGRNNHVYAWAPDDTPPICIKIYKMDERRRAEREWTALTHLNTTCPGDAPAPLWFDHHNPPAIGMTMLPGTPLPELPAAEQRRALKALATTHARLQDAPLPAPLHDLQRVDSYDHYIQRLTRIWPAQLADAATDPLTPQMFTLLQRWQQHLDGHRPAGPPVFSRGDSNLLNWLWDPDEQRLRCVDFEFAGHSTPTFDAADLTEHISARAIPDQTWVALLPDLGITTEMLPYYRTAQMTCALRWLAVLWKQRRQRPEEFHIQLDRAQNLLAVAP